MTRASCLFVLIAVPACSDGSTAASGVDAGGAPTSSSSSSSSSSSGGAPDAAAPPSADPCATSPILPAERPSATNTGVPAGTTLEPGGDLKVTKAGTVVDAADITGRIDVEANDVTIKNSKVHSVGGESAMAIVVKQGVTGTKILHSEIFTTKGGYIGISASNTFVCASYIHGWENGLTVGGGMMIQGNYIDRLVGGQPGPHFDGIEIYGGGAPSRVWGNHIKMTDASDGWLGDTGAINLTAWTGDIDDVEMNGNWLGGGSYTLYVDEQNGDKATAVKITNNRFYRGTAAFGTHLIRRDASVTAWSGNVFDDDGSAIAK